MLALPDSLASQVTPHCQKDVFSDGSRRTIKIFGLDKSYTIKTKRSDGTVRLDTFRDGRPSTVSFKKAYVGAEVRLPYFDQRNALKDVAKATLTTTSVSMGVEEARTLVVCAEEAMRVAMEEEACYAKTYEQRAKERAEVIRTKETAACIALCSDRRGTHDRNCPLRKQTDSKNAPHIDKPASKIDKDRLRSKDTR